ncbi:MAG TPA: DNA cytosine methyltransferase [Candidatus Kapabacteria bacterium]|nr:DNA cytosine methyltransferase [Candidatus Kapabacteria bacterium]
MTDYIERINTELRSSREFSCEALDLFGGCGGLSLGFESLGISTVGFEKDPDAVNTYNRNLKGHCENVLLSLDSQYPSTKILIGGPPCQPFSVGGHQFGLHDSRDGFPIFIAAVEKLQPEIFLFENVRGLLYSNRWYFDEIVSALEKLGYLVEHRLLNAIKYGVPQNRERLFVVGHRGKFRFPAHEAKAYTVSDAIGDSLHSFEDDSKFLTESMDQYIKKYEIASKCINPRDLYPNRPSRTLTCRNIAAPTGDMIRLRLPDGRRRRLSVREAARLQSFPDWFRFEGNETSQFYQIGNAVPPMLGRALAKSVVNYLDSQFRHSLDDIMQMNLESQSLLLTI